MDTATAEIHAAAINAAEFSAEWEAGSRGVQFIITGARAWAPRGDDGPVRVYIDYTVQGSRFDAPSKLWWDGEELHAEGLNDLSSRKRAAAGDALDDLEDEITDAVDVDVDEITETASVVADALVSDSITDDMASEHGPIVEGIARQRAAEMSAATPTGLPNDERSIEVIAEELGILIVRPFDPVHDVEHQIPVGSVLVFDPVKQNGCIRKGDEETIRVEFDLIREQVKERRQGTGW